MSACPIPTILGLCLAGTALAAEPALPDVTAYDAILQAYVRDDGKVRYGALRRNLAPLDGFVRQMSATSPHSRPELFPSKAAKLAYWINAYNALVLWAFAQDYPEKKDRLGGLLSRGLFFYQRKFTVGGQK